MPNLENSLVIVTGITLWLSLFFILRSQLKTLAVMMVVGIFSIVLDVIISPQGDNYSTASTVFIVWVAIVIVILARQLYHRVDKTKATKLIEERTVPLAVQDVQKLKERQYHPYVGRSIKPGSTPKMSFGFDPKRLPGLISRDEELRIFQKLFNLHLAGLELKSIRSAKENPLRDIISFDLYPLSPKSP